MPHTRQQLRVEHDAARGVVAVRQEIERRDQTVRIRESRVLRPGMVQSAHEERRAHEEQERQRDLHDDQGAA